ncbi:MAG: hypothetical protein MUE50_19095 [Pirellulaceae bacterium]|jgi:hypothetical protein|nr:hypothetical protein [Pirellulaceae bacterium]
MSASDEWVFSLLMSLGRMLPMFLVWFIGLVIALVRWPRCPAVSLLVVAASVLAGMTSVATQVIYMVLPRYWDAAGFARIAGIIGVASAFVHACAWVCMLAAAFLGRAKEPSK